MKLSLFLLLAILISCGKKAATPAGILAPEKMEQVIYDLMEADVFLIDYVFKDSVKERKEETMKMYQRVYMIHDISHEDFVKSFNYYRDRPLMMKTVFDSLNRLNRNTDPSLPQPSTPLVRDSSILKKFDSLRKKRVPGDRRN